MQKDFHLQLNLYASLINIFKHKIQKSNLLKDNITSLSKFKENNALIQYEKSDYYPILFRSFGSLFYKKEKKRLNEHFPLITGFWDLENKFNILIGDTLFKKIIQDKEDQKRILESITNQKPVLINLLYLPVAKNINIDIELFPLRIFKLKIVGIFSSSYEDYDNIIFSHLRTADTIFKENEHLPLDSFGLFIKDLKKIPLIKEELKKIFYPIFIEIDDWESKNPNMMRTFEWERQILSVILFIMFISSIIITLYIHLNLFFFRKRYSFAILKAIGISHQKIRNILFTLGLFISFSSLVLGNILSILFLKSLPIWKIWVKSIFYYFSYSSQMNQNLDLLNSDHLNLEIFLSVNILSSITLLVSLFICTKKISQEKIIKNLNSE